MKHPFIFKGSPYDNACIESFHAVLKKKEVIHVQYTDYYSAKIAMFKFIESWYNHKRFRGSIGDKTAQEMENTLRYTAYQYYIQSL